MHLFYAMLFTNLYGDYRPNMVMDRPISQTYMAISFFLEYDLCIIYPFICRRSLLFKTWNHVLLI